jgi:hypothetical protein
MFRSLQNNTLDLRFLQSLSLPELPKFCPRSVRTFIFERNVPLSLSRLIDTLLSLILVSHCRKIHFLSLTSTPPMNASPSSSSNLLLSSSFGLDFAPLQAPFWLFNDRYLSISSPAVIAGLSLLGALKRCSSWWLRPSMISQAVLHPILRPVLASVWSQSVARLGLLRLIPPC